MAVKPKVGIFLLGGPIEGSGGAERRFARAFKYFQRSKDFGNVFLITHPEMIKWLEEAFIKIGHDNVIFAEMEKPLKSKNIFHRYYCHIKHSMRYYSTLSRIVEKNGLDIIHLVSPHLHFIPFFLFKRKKPKLVFSLVGYPAFTENIGMKAKMVFRFYFERADMIDTLYGSFLKVFPGYERKTQVTACSFTDYERFYPSPRKEKWIVFAGRLEARKNPMLLLDAALNISDELRSKGWRVIILGKGELEGAMREFNERNNIGDIISIESAPDISPVLNSSSIFLSLQSIENYPSQALLEAMASENAVIATDAGETRRLINDGNGILLKNATADELSAALLFLIENEDARKRFGEKARQSVVDVHRLDLWANYLSRIWDEAYMNDNASKQINR
jgi:GalNAc-alpha-(1->4)-GalNAc-alpha-(1->3)-diNAcBac-PP-undecaprenol alpha-1,4-N-acetyl-D-galactosaminyltransferase